MKTDVALLNRSKDIYLYLSKKPKGTSTSTKELTEQYGCSDKTIHRAMEILKYNGLITRSNRGWVAVPKRIINSAQKKSS